MESVGPYSTANPPIQSAASTHSVYRDSPTIRGAFCQVRYDTIQKPCHSVPSAPCTAQGMRKPLGGPITIGGLTSCNPFGIPSMSRWTGVSTIV